jgi:chemotaxis protein methyltransferase CheR
MEGIIDINDDEFLKITGLVYDRFGIKLGDKKRELVKGRLNKLIKSLGYTNFSDYYDSIMNDSTSQSLLDLIDKISTNHSYFFRESDHFEYLTSVVMPELVIKKKAARSTEIKIWCAGCATGEEPYTLAMILSEYFGAEKKMWELGILATDISISALATANRGMYVEERAKNIPPQLKFKYFEKMDDEIFKVRDEIKKMVLFKRLNLMRDDFPFKGKFDIIFCRNVMIYFDSETRLRLVGKFHDFLNDDGYLFIGHSESLLKETRAFKYIKPAVYRRVIET